MFAHDCCSVFKDYTKSHGVLNHINVLKNWMYLEKFMEQILARDFNYLSKIQYKIKKQTSDTKYVLADQIHFG